jgi:hypothetical protein
LSSSHNSALWRMDLVGMHPQWRQVPPSLGVASMRAVLRPHWPARMAAVYPAGPPPMMATSKISAGLAGAGAVFCATLKMLRFVRG